MVVLLFSKSENILSEIKNIASDINIVLFQDERECFKFYSLNKESVEHLIVDFDISDKGMYEFIFRVKWFDHALKIHVVSEDVQLKQTCDVFEDMFFSHSVGSIIESFSSVKSQSAIA